jgi:hypothetical protein
MAKIPWILVNTLQVLKLIIIKNRMSRINMRTVPKKIQEWDWISYQNKKEAKTCSQEAQIGQKIKKLIRLAQDTWLVTI